MVNIFQKCGAWIKQNPGTATIIGLSTAVLGMSALAYLGYISSSVLALGFTGAAAAGGKTQNLKTLEDKKGAQTKSARPETDENPTSAVPTNSSAKAAHMITPRAESVRDIAARLTREADQTTAPPAKNTLPSTATQNEDRFSKQVPAATTSAHRANLEKLIARGPKPILTKKRTDKDAKTIGREGRQVFFKAEPKTAAKSANGASTKSETKTYTEILASKPKVRNGRRPMTRKPLAERKTTQTLQPK